MVSISSTMRFLHQQKHCTVSLTGNSTSLCSDLTNRTAKTEASAPLPTLISYHVTYELGLYSNKHDY